MAPPHPGTETKNKNKGTVIHEMEMEDVQCTLPQPDTYDLVPVDPQWVSSSVDVKMSRTYQSTIYLMTLE